MRTRARDLTPSLVVCALLAACAEDVVGRCGPTEGCGAIDRCHADATRGGVCGEWSLAVWDAACTDGYLRTRQCYPGYSCPTESHRACDAELNPGTPAPPGCEACATEAPGEPPACVPSCAGVVCGSSDGCQGICAAGSGCRVPLLACPVVPVNGVGVDGVGVCDPWQLQRWDSPCTSGYTRVRACNPAYDCRLSDHNGCAADLDSALPAWGPPSGCDACTD